MIKEDPYKVKFHKLLPWACEVFQVLKKDLRNDHLLKNPNFARKHFPKRALDKLTTEEFAAAYFQEIVEGDEDLGEKIFTRWVLKNGDLYQHFVTALSQINPKYDEIELLSDEEAVSLMNSSVALFGVIPVYIFSILNAVAFSQKHLDELKERALVEQSQTQLREEASACDSVEALKEHHEREIRKLAEKWDQKLRGVERKYLQDVEGLKKQIAHLHKKLGENARA